MSSLLSDLATFALPTEELARLNAVLQAELVAIKAETTAKVASIEDAIANLAHENALLKRRLYGNRTEGGNTSELQLALGDLLAGEAQLQKELDDAVAKAEDAVEPEPKPAPGARATPKGRRDLSASKLPRVLVEILDEEREASGCRRIDFEVRHQLMFRRGGFAVLVKRVAKYEVIRDGEATVEMVPSPETLFPRALLHTSAIAHIITSKFTLRRAALPARAGPGRSWSRTSPVRGPRHGRHRSRRPRATAATAATEIGSHRSQRAGASRTLGRPRRGYAAANCFASVMSCSPRYG